MVAALAIIPWVDRRRIGRTAGRGVGISERIATKVLGLGDWRALCAGGGIWEFRPESGMSANDRLWTIRCWGINQFMSQPPSKSERMEIRKAIGNRSIPGPSNPPTHRGPDYLTAHACFDCRKSWKLSEDSAAICPECGKSAHFMGIAFKAPKKTDKEQWKKVERLWMAGFRFFSNTGWRDDVAPYPERLREVSDFIRQNPKHPFRVQS